MKKSLLWMMIILISLTLMSAFTISGCKKGTAAETSAAETTAAETTSVETTTAETTTAETTTGEKVTLRIASFQGGYGREWLDEAIRLLKEKNPNVEVDLLFDPKIAEQLQPMFVAGNPPDVVLPGGFFDRLGAILEGQFKPLDDLLNSKAIDKDMLFKDTFEKGTFTAATFNGHTWYIPMWVSTYGWWYNETIWNKNEWVPPKTWDEAYALFDKMKAAGVGPIANQGIYPLYIRYTYLPEFIARLAGPQKFEACWNLKPNSWTDPEVVKAISFIAELEKKYFQEGHLGMNHLQSQAEVMVGNAGMIACGNWFPKEEEQVWPEGSEIRAMPYPPFEESSYPQKVYVKDGDVWQMCVIPTEAKQPELAVEFYKILFSEQVQKFAVEKTGALTSYKDSAQWLPDNKFARAIKSTLEYYKDADYTIPQQEILDFSYPEIAKAIDDNILKMFDDKITPEQAAAAIQKAIDDYIAKPDAFIHEFKLGVE